MEEAIFNAISNIGVPACLAFGEPSTQELREWLPCQNTPRERAVGEVRLVSVDDRTL